MMHCREKEREIESQEFNQNDYLNLIKHITGGLAERMKEKISSKRKMESFFLYLHKHNIMLFYLFYFFFFWFCLFYRVSYFVC